MGYFDDKSHWLPGIWFDGVWPDDVFLPGIWPAVDAGGGDLPDLPDGFSFVIHNDNYVLSGSDYVITETP